MQLESDYYHFISLATIWPKYIMLLCLLCDTKA